MLKDWVLNLATWANTSPSGQIDPTEGLELGEVAFEPLTFSRLSPSIQEVGVPEVANRMLALRTMGYIHYHIEPPIGGTWEQVYSRNWRAMVMTRITRYPQEPDGITVGDIAGYELSNLASANDQYVYHHEKMLVNQASNDWLGTAGGRATLSWSIRVNVGYRRVLEDFECMALGVQFQQCLAPADGVWQDVQQGGLVRLRVFSRLRTFVQADT